MRKIIRKFINISEKKNKFFLIFLLFVLFILLFPIQNIEIGQQGILYNSVTGKHSSVFSSGWHIVIPFVHTLTSYPINDRTYKISRDIKNWNNGIDASIITPTSDNQKVSIDATFVYVLDINKIGYIYEKFNGQEIYQIEKNFLDDIFKASVIGVVTQYSTYDVYSTKRGEIQEKAFEDISIRLADSGIIIKDMYIELVRLSPETESIINAKALAEAARIEAQGQSDANMLISNSLNDRIMKYEALQKMSESLKIMIVPSDTENQLDFTSIFDQILDGTEGLQREVE